MTVTACDCDMACGDDVTSCCAMGRSDETNRKGSKLFSGITEVNFVKKALYDESGIYKRFTLIEDLD